MSETFPDDNEETCAVGPAVGLLSGQAIISPTDCLHCLRVAVNAELSVCAVCRELIPGPAKAGVTAYHPSYFK